MSKIVGMLIWAGTPHGGPATIQGFDTVEACDRARPAVEAAYSAIAYGVSSRCVALPRGAGEGAAEAK